MYYFGSLVLDASPPGSFRIYNSTNLILIRELKYIKTKNRLFKILKISLAVFDSFYN